MRNLIYLVSIFFLLIIIGCSKTNYMSENSIMKKGMNSVYINTIPVDTVPMDTVLKGMAPEKAQLFRELASRYKISFSKLDPNDSSMVSITDTALKQLIESRDNTKKE